MSMTSRSVHRVTTIASSEKGVTTGVNTALTFVKCAGYVDSPVINVAATLAAVW